jgi:hypothetical protein
MDKYTSDLTYEEKKYIDSDIKSIGEMSPEEIRRWSNIAKTIDNSRAEPTCACEGVVKNAVPVDGTLTFTGYPDEILLTLRALLDCRKIEMTVDWTVIDK